MLSRERLLPDTALKPSAATPDHEPSPQKNPNVDIFRWKRLLVSYSSLFLIFNREKFKRDCIKPHDEHDAGQPPQSFAC